jgi:FkbM family methyltransferase
MNERPPQTKQSILVRIVKAYLPRLSPAVIFDVGANVGQSAAMFTEAFPRAKIYAFEPVAATFQTLGKRVAALPNVSAFNLALGRRSGSVEIESQRNSVMNRIVERRGEAATTRTEATKMMPGDAFSAEHHVERIDLLKIDTEGHDLEVLVGFRSMLEGMRIGLVDTEVGMNRGNTRHVPFEAVKAYLDPLGYHVFHLHEQMMEIPFSGRPVLRRCNVTFISEALARANERKKR